MMHIEESPSRFGSPQEIQVSPWVELGDNVYECRALVCEEAEGGFSAHALRLPGVVSQGETFDEAIANLEEAFRGVIETYLDEGMKIPWNNADVKRHGIERRFLVTV